LSFLSTVSIEKNPHNVVLGKIQLLEVWDYFSKRSLGTFFFFFFKDSRKQNKCIDDRIRWGKTEKSWSYTTPEKMDTRSATICFCLNPMIFWFPGLESLGPVKWLKQDNPRLLRFSLILFYHLGDEPYHCFVNCLDIHSRVIQYFEGVKQKLSLFEKLENHS